MTALRVVALPVGSIVATATEVFIKTEKDDTGEWYKTCSDDLWWDSEVQSDLDRDAQVLRVGTGSGQ